MEDVVEGSAMKALPLMKQMITQRPKYFNSLEKALEYTLSHSIVKRKDSAIMSLPSLFTQEGNKFYWRTRLLATSDYWSEWFKGLDEIFLGVNLPKLLILADPERLDKELTIGQMQGKFALKCPMAKTGHHIHEDAPEETRDFLFDFIKSFRLPLSTQEARAKLDQGNISFKNRFN